MAGAVQDEALVEDRYDKKPERGSIRMGTAAHCCFPGYLVRVLAANAGTWFQNVVGVWLMTRFTASPLMIALMQTATTLPVFLVGFPAGALADIVNRRLLIVTQGLILVTTAMLSVLTLAGLMNAPLLLGFTFVLGLGAILANPAWQAVNAELVFPPRPSRMLCNDGL